MEQVKEHEGHIAAHPLAFGEHSLNALVAITRARLTVEDGGREGPRCSAGPGDEQGW